MSSEEKDDCRAKEPSQRSELLPRLLSFNCLIHSENHHIAVPILLTYTIDKHSTGIFYMTLGHLQDKNLLYIRSSGHMNTLLDTG